MNAVSANIVPADELQRMAAVRRYDILDTPPDGSFDRVTAMAARRFGVPIAIVSIVDHDRIWFKSHHGMPAAQISRELGLCASAILSPDPHIVLDASTDPRTLANPLVAGEFGLRFYAGVPLRTSDGHNLGTLCVIDREPRPVDQNQIDDLKDLASVVMDQLELRISARLAVARAEMLAREIDHRVMNSLQFVSSMLTLQSKASNLTDTAGQLRLAANRVGAVARVHRHFYAQEASETMCCVTFLRRLCADLSTILGNPIVVDGDEEDVSTTQIQPIGLIVNELVTNAAKHGKGTISVAYRVREGTRELAVCDEGEGIPLGFELEGKGSSLGMKVVNSLARQLGGKVALTPNRGGQRCCFSVSFPA